MERIEADHANGVDAALVVTTSTIEVEPVAYDQANAGTDAYDKAVHEAYDKKATSMKLGIAQGITFEGVTYRDDILADGTPEEDIQINSLLDSVGVGTGTTEEQMAGADAKPERRLEGIRVNVYEYDKAKGSISSTLATDADGNAATIVTDDTGFFRFRLKAGKTYIIKTSETVANRLIKPTLNTWSNDATAYQRDGFYYHDSDVLVADNDLRYVSGSARTYPLTAALPLDADGKVIYQDPANKWLGYERQDKLALGYVDGTKGYLGNNVWSDANYDGVQQADEEGVGQGRDNGGVKVKLETWYYGPTETRMEYVQKKDSNGNPLWKTNAAGVPVIDPDTGEKTPVMEWTMTDEGEFRWQLYPGDELREAYTGDAAAAGTYLFRDVSSYVVDPRDTRNLDNDYKTKRLAGYRLRIDQEDLNALDEDYAITVRNAFMTDNTGNLGQSVDSDSDLMTKPVATGVLRQANDVASGYTDGTAYYIKNGSVFEPMPAGTDPAVTRYVKVANGNAAGDDIYVAVADAPFAPGSVDEGDGEAEEPGEGFNGTQSADGTNSEDATTLTYYLNEQRDEGWTPEPGSFADGYIVLASIGQHSATGTLIDRVTGAPLADSPELAPFAELNENTPVEVTYTTVYRNETDATQQITITDPYPTGKGLTAATDVVCVDAACDKAGVPVNMNATDTEGNPVVRFGTDDVDGSGAYTGRIKLAPGESVTVTATYRFRTVKTVVHHAVIGGTEDGEVETNTVAHKVKRDLEALRPVLPLYQSSMLRDGDKVTYDENGQETERVAPTIATGDYVTGKSFAQATAAIEADGLSVGRVIFKTELTGSALPGTVIGQVPVAGLLKHEGSPVNLIVAGPRDAAMNVFGATWADNGLESSDNKVYGQEKIDEDGIATGLYLPLLTLGGKAVNRYESTEAVEEALNNLWKAAQDLKKVQRGELLRRHQGGGPEQPDRRRAQARPGGRRQGLVHRLEQLPHHVEQDPRLRLCRRQRRAHHLQGEHRGHQRVHPAL